MPLLLRFLLLCLVGLPAVASASRLPEVSWRVEGFSLRNLSQEVGEQSESPLHGLWCANAESGWLAFLPASACGAPSSLVGQILMVMARSACGGIQPGTVVGWCAPAATKGEYDCHMFTDVTADSLLADPKRFSLKLSQPDRLILTPVTGGLKFRPLGLIPYMFRSLVVNSPQKGAPADGFFRLWPAPPVSPVEPRCL